MGSGIQEGFLEEQLKSLSFHHQKSLQKKKMLESVWRKGNPFALLMGCKMVQSLWKTVWSFLKKLNIEQPHDLAIPLLGI